MANNFICELRLIQLVYAIRFNSCSSTKCSAFWNMAVLSSCVHIKYSIPALRAHCNVFSFHYFWIFRCQFGFRKFRY